MQNFMKTIIAAVQAWTKKEIKESTADWNENDSSKDSYIKNKTHWTEVPEIVIVDNLTYADYDTGNVPKCIFVPGQEYHITWNGILYTTICRSDGGCNIIADYKLGCPFRIDDNGGNGLYIIDDNESTDWTVSISKAEIIHKLDPKYFNLIIKSPNGTQFQISVADDGTLSSTPVK